MKVLIVMPSGYNRGGAEAALLSFCHCATLAGCELAVVLLEPGPLEHILEKTGVSVCVYDAGRLRQFNKLLKTVRNLRQVIRKERPSVVLGWMSKAHIYSGVAAALESVPSVYFQHGKPDGGWVDRASRLIPATGALACSQMTASTQENVAPHRVINVFAPVDLQRFASCALPTSSECRIKLDLPVKGRIVGMVSRLQHWKGVHIFVKAIGELQSSCPDCFGVIVGGVHHLEPGYADDLKALIHKEGLESRLRMAGEQTNVAEWMQAMDVVVHGSDCEPFGMVVVEAMALGKPVVATRPGGPEEIISDGINGTLIPWNNASVMSSAMRHFLDQPGFAADCGAAATIRAQNFSSEKYARRIRDGLDQLLGNRSASNESVRWMVVMPSGHRLGGAEEILSQFVRTSLAAGIELYPVFLEAGDLACEIREMLPATKIFDAGRLRNPLAYSRAVQLLFRELRRVRPEIVLSWMTKAHIYAGVAARLAGVPAFYFQRGLPDGGTVDRLSRIPSVKGVLTCSRFVAAEQSRVTKAPIRAVCSSADSPRLAELRGTPISAMRQSLGLSINHSMVGMVGRLQHWKGMHVFAAAMARVVQEVPQALGIIVGGPHHMEPNYLPYLKKRIFELGLRESLLLVGAQTNAPQWMQAMDVVVHASHREPFGIVVIEAMTLGKPVVATIPGGPEEVITHGVDGLLVPWNDPDALAKAILRFLQDPKFGAACGKAASVRAQDFSSENYARKVKTAVEDILRDGRTSVQA